MSLITTRPATSQTWDDVQAALTGGGVGKTCQCGWVVMRNAQYLAATPEQRREFLRSQVASETPRSRCLCRGQARGMGTSRPSTSASADRAQPCGGAVS